MDDSLTRMELDRLLKMMEPMPSSTVQVMMRSIYETSNELYNHYSLRADSDPLARVAMHPPEIYQKSTGLYAAIRRYEHQRINDRYGLSLTEYLDLPREMIKMMTLAAEDAIKEREELEEHIRQEASEQTKSNNDPLGPDVSVRRKEKTKEELYNGPPG